MTAADPDLNVRVPLRVVIASIVGLWLCYFALTSIPSAERPSLHTPSNSPATPATHASSSR